MILVTGGVGFIGSNFVLDWLEDCHESVLTVDKLTYAGNLENLTSLEGNARYIFVQADIGERTTIRDLLSRYHPRAIINFAAETHVDRSIGGPEAFVQTNVVGTYNLLEAAREYWCGLPREEASAFRFVHISTDEVYGSLNQTEPGFREESAYRPNNPYAASKAAGDHFVRAWYRTYGLPVLITNSSNNFGPRQHPEKLIPQMILNALSGKSLPVYGDGRHVRDWLYVRDNCAAIRCVLEHGQAGETYNIGGSHEVANIDLVKKICVVLDELRPYRKPYADLIRFVMDRPGHDRRYAIDATRIRQELGWQPNSNFESAIFETVRWYLDHPRWIRNVQERGLGDGATA